MSEVRKPDQYIGPKDWREEYDDDFRCAVMKAMWPLPCANVSFPDREDLERAVARCAKWREWAETSSELDDRTRRAYLHWIEYCEYQNARAAEELKTRRHQFEYESYLSRERERQARVAKIQVIKPPQKF